MSLCQNTRSVALAVVILLASACLGESVRDVMGFTRASRRGVVTTPRREALSDLSGWDGLAVLGGFRVALADLAWIRMVHAWEQSNRPATMRSIRVATRLNPASLYFWINGARIVAYDMAAWRIQEAEAAGHVPQAEKQRIARQQGHEALEILAKAEAFFPGRALLEIEKAQLELHALRNPGAAAARFSAAANCSDAPLYCIRIAAELVRKEGRLQEAQGLLKQGLQSLDERVQRGRVARVAEERAILMSRIDALQKELEAVTYK